MVISKNCSIEVTFSDLFYRKINWLVKNWDVEIGGFLVGDWNNDGIYIEDILIFKQQVHKTNVTKFGISDILMINEVGVETTNRIIGEWHSHNTMSTFWSATDEEFIKGYLTNKDGAIIRNSLISVVSAYKSHFADPYDHKVRIDIKGFKGMNATFDDLEYSVEESLNESLEDIYSEKKVIMGKAEELVKPLKDQIELILKETQEKITILKNSVELIEKNEDNELGEYLKGQIEEKVERESIVVSDFSTKNMSKFNSYTDKTDFQSHLGNITDIGKEKQEYIQKVRDDTFDRYMKAKRGKWIIIESLDEEWADTLIYYIKLDEDFTDLEIQKEKNEDTTFEILIKGFVGKKPWKKCKNLLIDKLIRLETSEFEEDIEEDTKEEKKVSDTDFTEDFDEVNRSLEEKIMNGEYSEYTITNYPSNYDYMENGQRSLYE